MAMVVLREANSPFAAVEVVCNLLSSCRRVGDLLRADEWAQAAERHLGLGGEHGPPFLYAHCRSMLGLLLCDVGRWHEAEVTLRLASKRAGQAGPRSEGQVRAALAELWVLQGRLDDAERLILGRREHPDCLLALASLLLARQQYDQAVGVARQGIRHLGDDRVRTARLLAICVEAELAQDHPSAARLASDEVNALARDRNLPVLHVRAALARGQVAEAGGDRAAAVGAYEDGLRVLPDGDWPLLRADLHLALGRSLVGTDTPSALAEAQAAHVIYERIGSPAAITSARLLKALGVEAQERPTPRGATATLTPREYEVLQLLREGLSNGEIASRQHNSVRTIEHHVSAILTKLGLRGRAEAAVYAAALQSRAKPATPGSAGMPPSSAGGG